MSLSTEFKVGLFTIIGFGSLIGTAFMLEKSVIFQKKQHFKSELKNAGGVSEHTQVRIAGVQVGRVTRVMIDNYGAKMVYTVTDKVKIPEDSHIEIKSRGMLGDVFVEIERGQSTRFLASGATLPVEGNTADIQTLIANMNDIAGDVKKVVSTLADALSGEGDNSLKGFMKNLEATAKRIADIVERNDTKIDDILTDIAAFTAQLKKLSTDENSKKIANIIDNLNASTADIKQMTAKIRKGEGTLGELIEKNDTSQDIRKTLAEIQKTVSPFSNLHFALEDRFEYRYRNAEGGDRFQNQFNVMISTVPDRYYMVGVANGGYGRKVTDTTTTVNGTTTNVQKNYTEDTWLWKWNLQVSQRLGFIGADFLGVRAGFFRSTAGVAVDIYAPHNIFVGSAEFYNFNGFPGIMDNTYGPRGPLNIKLYGNLYLASHFYLTAGVTRLALLQKPWPFVGAGLFFSDQDIRGVYEMIRGNDDE